MLVVHASSARAQGRAEPQAHAAESAAAKPLERARARYREGVAAYQDGRFRDAIDLFLEADHLAPSAALSFNIGAAYEKLGEPAAALRWYHDYLRRAPEATDRARVEALISGFEHDLETNGVQQLTVSSTPEEAELSVDGRAVGTTPWTGEIAPGSHVLSWTLAGRASESRTIDLPSDHAIDVAVELQPQEESEPSATPSPGPAPSAPARAVAASTREAKPDNRKLFTTLGWVGVAAGGAALGGALVFELLRESAESAAMSDHTQVGYADKLDTMDGRKTAARVLLGVGGGLVATGGALLWLGHGPARSVQTAIAVTCGPGACASSVHGRF